MAGRNFLFVPGPTNVPDRIQRAMMVSMEDHRSPNFPHLTHTIMAGLKDIFRSKNGTPFIFPSSPTLRITGISLFWVILKFKVAAVICNFLSVL